MYNFGRDFAELQKIATNDVGLAGHFTRQNHNNTNNPLLLSLKSQQIVSFALLLILPATSEVSAPKILQVRIHRPHSTHCTTIANANSRCPIVQ